MRRTANKGGALPRQGIQCVYPAVAVPGVVWRVERVEFRPERVLSSYLK